MSKQKQIFREHCILQQLQKETEEAITCGLDINFLSFCPASFQRINEQHSDSESLPSGQTAEALLIPYVNKTAVTSLTSSEVCVLREGGGVWVGVRTKDEPQDEEDAEKEQFVQSWSPFFCFSFL